MEMSDTLPVNQSLVSRLSESVKDWLTDSCMGFMFLYAAPGILFAGTRKKKDVFDSANVEKVDIMEDSLLPWGEFFSRLSALDSWKKEGRLKKATDDEVGLLVKMLKENVPGSGVIKVVLEREGVKELHNRTDYFS